MNNSAPIKVQIPDSEDVDLVSYFQELLEEDFRNALDFDVVAKSDRAVLDDVNITVVVLNGNEIEVEYHFEFSAYLGCRDANWVDSDTDQVCGMKVGNYWVFKRHIPWEPRSPVDEF